jgi:hypothetical protein
MMYIQRIYIGHIEAIWRDLAGSINCETGFNCAPGKFWGGEEGDQVGTSRFTDFIAELDLRIL